MHDMTARRRRRRAGCCLLLILFGLLMGWGRHGARASARVASDDGTASVTAGETITILTSVVSPGDLIALVDIEVYSPNGDKTFQQFFDNQSLAAGQSSDYSVTWPVPASLSEGTYTVKLGVFAPGWTSLLMWINQAAQITVSAAPPDALGNLAATPAAASPTVAAPPAAAPGAPPPYFPTLAPGSTLPAADQCAAQVRRSVWEPRPENFAANHTTGTAVARLDGVNAAGNGRFAGRIDGNFTGTTDEIIQWGACKWGFDEDTVRAVAVQESWWRQATLGDLVNGKYESFGLLQVRAPVHTGTFPWSQLSTAFNVDYALAWRRACIEGYMEWIPPSAKGDEWGCIGLWFSGRWHDPGAETYISQTKNWLARKTWLQSGF